ncbi:MAG: hypothetical protein R2752_01980 [Vicinamibacterales bacterium]
MVLSPHALRAGVLTLIVAAPVLQASGDPVYAVVATVPAAVNGRFVHSFVFDPDQQVLYAASDDGLLHVDLRAERPRLEGPVFDRKMYQLEFAPDLGRLFFLARDPDLVGYVDVRRPGARPVVLASGVRGSDLAYEPERQEVYVAFARRPTVLVFDARSAAPNAVVELPGWFATGLEATRGTVFAMLGDVPGLFAIDAATHQAAAWPVKGRVSTPAQIEADPTGRYLFLAWNREFAAIDIATATVLGRVVTATRPTIAFDVDTGQLIASWTDESPGPTQHLVTYDVGPDGLRERARLDEGRNHGIGESFDHGFVQRGSDWSIWRGVTPIPSAATAAPSARAGGSRPGRTRPSSARPSPRR